jgi:uncharacterized protein (DUF433 family)
MGKPVRKCSPSPSAQHELLANGAAVEEVLADHPSFYRKDVPAAIAYATEQTSQAVIY